MTLQFKFNLSASTARRRTVIAELQRQGAAAVRPLFPGEKDAELAALYLVDCANPKASPRLREFLDKSKVVEYVEDMVQRKLVR